MIAMINVKEIWLQFLLVVIPTVVPRSNGGLLYDLRYGGNEQARYLALTYWDGALHQIDGDRNERAAKEFCAWLIKTYILDNVAYITKQSPAETHKQLIQNMLQKQRLMQ